jgi:beta-galactosidase
MHWPKVSNILHGGDYNPEQWPEEVWLEDMRLMKAAGVNFVSIGIFSWSLLQSGPGCFHFEWLDRLMDLLAANGIHADLATGTASPPPWLTRLHPDMLPVTVHGTRLWPGSRQHYNPSSHAYREASAELVRAMALRYGGPPALAAWHINNEYGCHVREDFSDESAAAFRVWLRARHGSLDALNEQWGTAFWSQHYYDWDEILPPREAPTFTNPGQTLDWMRFCSDAMLECYLLEKEILREITPDVPVTTNYVIWHKPFDYRKWAGAMDFVSWDAYPEPLGDYHDMAFTNDFIRSLKDGAPFALMEQTATQVQWRPQNPLKPPGVMRLWSHQTIAQGADLIGFFQWRQSRAGAEKFHGAVVSHASSAQTRVFQEVAGLGADLRKLAPVLGTRVAAEAAIYFDADNWWALEMPGKPSADIQYLEQLRLFHTPLADANIPVDFAFGDSDFTRYKLLIAPACYLMQPGLAEKLEHFVKAGGTLLVTFFSGIVDASDRVLTGGYPASLRTVLGIEVEEWNPLLPGSPNAISAFGETYEASRWSEIVNPGTAEVLAAFTKNWFAGKPALTRNRLAKGSAYYLATQAEPRFYTTLIARLAEEAGVRPLLDAPAGVQAVLREKEGARFLFLLNHNQHPVELSNPALSGRELLTETDCAGTLALNARDVAVIYLKGKSSEHSNCLGVGGIQGKLRVNHRSKDQGHQ